MAKKNVFWDSRKKYCVIKVVALLLLHNSIKSKLLRIENVLSPTQNIFYA